MLLSDFKRGLRGSRQSVGQVVSFTTKGGDVVEFTVTGARKSRKSRKTGKSRKSRKSRKSQPGYKPKAPNAYARYVMRHIQTFLGKGLSAPAAMKAVAKQYRAGKRSGLMR